MEKPNQYSVCLQNRVTILLYETKNDTKLIFCKKYSAKKTKC